MRAQSLSSRHSNSVILTYICQLWFYCIKNKMLRTITILVSGMSHDNLSYQSCALHLPWTLTAAIMDWGKTWVINIKTQSNCSRKKSLTVNFVVFPYYNYMCHIKLNRRIINRMKYYLSKHSHLMKRKINIEKITDPVKKNYQSGL